MSHSDFIWRFTPSRTEPELLERIFVQRQALLTSIQEKVSDSAIHGNMHHVLLVGPRGIGKTHLISLLNHRVTKAPALHDKLRIAWFLEDETITSFVQLLKRIYELLSDEYPLLFPPEWLDEQLEKPLAQIEKNLEAELVRQFHNHTLLLFIENLDYVFDGLGAEGQKKWRSFLQEHPFTCIVATAQRLFTGVQDRKQPFFGFFNPIHLKPLTVSDAVDLLTHIAEQNQQTDLVEFLKTPDGRSRVRAIHHLAGGNHRIYIVLSGFITKESLDELTQPFEKMADELTPYYQERMRWLSPQQRQIVEFLCSQDAPCTPKEIARQMLAAENTVSSQVKKLLAYGYVLRSPRGRESLYELAEPLMRLSSEVKDKKQEPLRLLVDFLCIWYRPERLAELSQSTNDKVIQLYLSEAMASLKTGIDPRLHAIIIDILRAKSENNLPELVSAMEELAGVTDRADVWGALALIQLDIHRHEAALSSSNMALDIDASNAVAIVAKMRSLYAMSRFEDFRKLHPIFMKTILFTLRKIKTTSKQVVETLKMFLSEYSDLGLLAGFGETLVRSLGDTYSSEASPRPLDEWRDLIVKVGSKYPEMELPIRIFRIGIEFLKTKDERVMLDLVATERRILRQALGMESMDEE